MKDETVIRGSEKMAKNILMDFEGMLKDYGVDKSQLLSENPQIERLLTLEARYRKAYKDNPTDTLRYTYNNYVSNAIRKLQELFPDKFAHQESEEEIISGKGNQIKETQGNSFSITSSGGIRRLRGVLSPLKQGKMAASKRNLTPYALAIFSIS